jgi:hypothetical protein
VEGLHRRSLDREQVLNRLWEIANLSPEMTRGSVTGQVKALSMIVAMENFIPDRRAVSSPEKKSPPAPTPEIYASAWLRKQQATTADPQPSPAPDQQEDSPDVPAYPASPGLAAEASADPGRSRSTFAKPSSPSEAPPPYLRGVTYVPDLRVPFSIKMNPFARPR